jgi:hypothetical protein
MNKQLQCLATAIFVFGVAAPPIGASAQTAAEQLKGSFTFADLGTCVGGNAPERSVSTRVCPGTSSSPFSVAYQDKTAEQCWSAPRLTGQSAAAATHCV